MTNGGMKSNGNRIRPIILNKMYNTKKVDYSKSAVFTVLVFLFVMMTDSFWAYTWENRFLYYLGNITSILIASVSIFILFYNSKYLNNTKILLFCFLPALGIALSAIVNTELSFGYFYKISFCFVGFLLSITVDFKSFAKAFERIMVFLCVWSLVLFCMAQFGLEEILPIVKNVGGLELHNGIFGFIAVHGDYYVRNWGVFWEPGAFQAYVCLAMIFNLFLLRDPKPYRLILFLVTIASTYSTTGIICAGLIALVYFLSNYRVAKSKQLINVIGAILVLAIVFVMLNPSFLVKIFSKLFVDPSESVSLGARYYSIFGNVQIMFSDGLFFGTGIAEYLSIYTRAVNELGYFIDMSNTNTLFVDFARFGWLLGLTNTVLLFKFSKALSKNSFELIGIFITLVILLFMENFSYSIVWMCIIYYGVDFYKKSDGKSILTELDAKEGKSENNISM